MTIGGVNLARAKFLAEKFRDTVTSDIIESEKDERFGSYCIAFLTVLATRYPEVVREMEERIVYKELR